MTTTKDQGMEVRWPFDKEETHAPQMNDECIIREYCHAGAPLCVDDTCVIIASAMNPYYREVPHLADRSNLFSERQNICTPRCSTDTSTVLKFVINFFGMDCLQIESETQAKVCSLTTKSLQSFDRFACMRTRLCSHALIHARMQHSRAYVR